MKLDFKAGNYHPATPGRWETGRFRIEMQTVLKRVMISEHLEVILGDFKLEVSTLKLESSKLELLTGMQIELPLWKRLLRSQKRGILSCGLNVLIAW